MASIYPSSDAERIACHNAFVALRGDLTTAWSTLVHDPIMRDVYRRRIAALSRQWEEEVMREHVSWRLAMERAHEARNVQVDLLRGRSTPIGRAISQFLKDKGPDLNSLIARHTKDLYGDKALYDSLTIAQKESVYAEIVAAAGRSNARVNALVVRGAKYGRGLLLISIGLSVYTIATSDDHLDAAKKEGAGMLAGIAGGAAGGALAGLVCGPGAPICVTIGAFVGGAAGALGVDMAWQ